MGKWLCPIHSYLCPFAACIVQDLLRDVPVPRSLACFLRLSFPGILALEDIEVGVMVFGGA